MAKIWAFIGVCIFHTLAGAKPLKTVHLQSLEVPPFVSDKMPAQGAAIYALKETFKKAGYKLEVRILPILRIRALKFRDPKVEGFFPSFVDEGFGGTEMTLSKLVYETPWVIIEHKDKVIQWQEPKDLTKYKGGHVQGYAIRSQVKKIYEDNKANIEGARDDATNLLKLANKRIDYIFTDAHIFKYLMATDPRLKEYENSLQINQKIVVMNRYGVAFKNTPSGKNLLQDFNKVANQAEFHALVESYFKEMGIPY